VTESDQELTTFQENRTILLSVLKRHPAYLLSTAFIISYLLYSLVSTIYPGILPYDPTKVNLSKALLAPNWQYPFGTDVVGRNIFLAVFFGAPIDAVASVAIIITAVSVGVISGAIAGYFGGLVEEVIMRVTDVFLSFPALILAVAIAAALGPGLLNAVIAIAAIWWPVYTRLARGEALSIRNQQFILAAKASGVSRARIVTSHVIPNLLNPIIAYATADVGNVIILFSVIGYLGLGAQPPRIDLGRLVFDGQNYIQFAPWYPILPGVAIFVIVIAFALLGDLMTELLSPRMRK